MSDMNNFGNETNGNAGAASGEMMAPGSMNNNASMDSAARPGQNNEGARGPVYQNMNGYYGNPQGMPNMNMNRTMNVPPVPPIRQPKKKKEHKFLKRFVSAAAIAAVCGLAGGLVFTGTTYFMAKATGQNYRNAVGNALHTADETSTPSIQATGSSSEVQGTGSVTAIVDEVMPSIVQVTNISLSTYNTWFGQTYTKETPSAGSGVIINKDSDFLYIATNNHMVENSKELTITFCDNTAVSATVQGTDKYSDLAVVKIPLKDISESTLSAIKTVTLGNSENVKVGDQAIVIGNAMGYGQSVTSGVISALSRLVTLQLEDGTIISNKLFMTDAAINPGNSGGALLDGNGRLIGIVNSKYVNSYVEAAGYAIPISSAKPILECLMSGTEIKDSDRDDSTSGRATNDSNSTKTNPNQTAFLGINGVDITEEMAANYNMPEGIYISRVYEQGGAAKAGISKRDIITAVNGEPVITMTKLQSVLSTMKPGDTIKLTVARYENNYIETDVNVTLGDRSTAQ